MWRHRRGLRANGREDGIGETMSPESASSARTRCGADPRTSIRVRGAYQPHYEAGHTSAPDHMLVAEVRFRLHPAGRPHTSGERRLALMLGAMDTRRHEGRGSIGVLCGWLPHCKSARAVALVGHRPVFGLRLRWLSTAGLDGFRGQGPSLLSGHVGLTPRRVVLIPGPTGSPSRLTVLATS